MNVLLLSAVVGFATWVVARTLVRMRHRSPNLDAGTVSPNWLSRQRGQRDGLD
jgi:hypothetical protein